MGASKFILIFLVIYTAKGSVVERLLGLNEIQHFNTYWELVDFLSPCTVYVSRSSLSLVDFQISALHYCSQQTKADQECVIVLPVVKVWNDDNWNYDAFINEFYYKVLSSVRFSKVCTVHLPDVQVEKSDANSWSFWARFLRFTRKHDYSIMSTSPSFSREMKKEALNLHKAFWRTSSRVFLLSSWNHSIISPCHICFSLEGETVIESPITMNDISVSFLRKSMDQYATGQSSNGVTCPYENSWNKKISSVGQYKMDTCVYSIFNWKYNTSHLHNLKPYYKSVSIQSPGLDPLAFGVDFLRVQYTIFVERRIPGTENLNYFALVAPFDGPGWVIVLVTFLYLGFVLPLTRYRSDSIYWIFATMLEQESDNKKLLNWRNWYLVGALLLGAILIRNVYTSALYTFMTTDSGPGYVPNSLHEAVYETNSTFLDGKVLIPLLGQILKKHMALQWKYPGKNIEMTDADKMVYKMFDRRLTLNGDIEHLIQNLNKNKCTDHPATDTESLRDAARHLNCVDKSRFVLLYPEKCLTLNFGYEFEDVAALKLLLYISHKHYIIEHSNQQAIYKETMFYIKYNDKYDPIFEGVLRYLVDSGIYGLQSVYFERNKLYKKVHYWLQKISKSKAELDLGLRAFMQWNGKACFNLYKQACSLEDLLDQSVEQSVKISDLTVVWLLYGILFVVCFVTLLAEYLISSH